MRGLVRSIGKNNLQTLEVPIVALNLKTPSNIIDTLKQSIWADQISNWYLAGWVLR